MPQRDTIHNLVKYALKNLIETEELIGKGILPEQILLVFQIEKAV